MLYRLITENINQQRIIEIVQRYFDSFTLIPAIGYWQGQREPALIIEVCSSYNHPNISENNINFIAQEIKELNHQQAILIQKIESSTLLLL